MDRRRSGLSRALGGLILISAAPSVQGNLFEDLLFEGYFGAGPLGWEYQDYEIEEARATGGRLMAGVLFNEHVGVEAHYAEGGTDTVDYETVNVEFEGLDGVFLRLNAPLWFIHTYALAGFSVVDMAIVPEENISLADAPSASDLSYGLGVELRTPESYALAADYVRYIDNSGFLFQAGTVSLKWRF
ncbi:outer membrane beta-barrel protein [Halorhodospira neutriphila]|uniref:Outer membrane protein beta-barrel domain-containing protein n=1 Tax=Halorhodospira neutriphila TaxID=168379 RepID=A0ABS1E3C7_9GAMM|nr:outer membrane beta-barrel protein [Halorhodospira neutriphila]MBK1725734.1 hypothetical protein [Halorhodospira neutriphila]